MEIEGYHNYLIYEDGKVFSKKRNIFLKATPGKNGYKCVKLYEDRKKKTITIHRLIALHYIPNPNNYPCVDHKDRDKENNHVSNLRWVTQQMNCQNIGLRKDNKLRIQYIHPTKYGYRFRKTVMGKIHTKYFKTLEEALKYKEEYLTNLQL